VIYIAPEQLWKSSRLSFLLEQQAIFASWFNEPAGWMAQRIVEHQQIRDELVSLLKNCEGMKVRPTEAGSYLFPQLPPLDVDIKNFVKILRHHAQVTVPPGTEFGPHFTNSVRLNFSRFPRNVNVHATVALAGIGFDQTFSRIIADPMVTTKS